MFRNKEYVYAVYREKSFSKAAAKLYVSQPCLSAMVKKVETKIGATLFDRNASPIQLTDVGVTYIQYVEKMMQYEQEFETYLNDIRGLKTGAVSIGASNVVASFILPELITRFSEKYPEIKVDLYEGNIQYLNTNLQAGALDLILDNYPVDEKLNQRIPLLQENLYVAVSKAESECIAKKYHVQGMTAEQVLIKAGSEKDAEAVPFSYFSQTPFIVLRKGNDTRMRYDQLCREAGAMPPVLLEVDQLATAYNICRNQFGATLVSDTLLKQNASASSLKYYKISSELTKREVFFHFPRNRYLSLPVKAFLEEARLFV